MGSRAPGELIRRKSSTALLPHTSKPASRVSKADRRGRFINRDIFGMKKVRSAVRRGPEGGSSPEIIREKFQYCTFATYKQTGEPRFKG